MMMIEIGYTATPLLGQSDPLPLKNINPSSQASFPTKSNTPTLRITYHFQFRCSITQNLPKFFAK